MRASIPARLAREIARQDAGAEIRISWVQLGLLAVFSILYAIAPRAEGTMGFNSVPYFLSAYGVASLIRLALAYRNWLFPPLVVLSILIDIVFICGLIFSFHIQYHEPASFYLKAPTMLYIFLFIALRALRFDPIYVAVTGTAAALGWAVLVYYAVVIDPDYPGRTRDFPMYVSGNMVLFGAELDKILVILAVTALMVYALVRARRTLVSAVRDQAAVSNLSKFFSAEVATIVGSEDPDLLKAGYGIDREAAIMMVDLRGFTTLSQTLSPDEAVTILARFHAHVVPEIRAAGGAIDKFLGDGILATFGAIHPSDTPAADALRAVDRVLAAVDACNGELAAAGGRHVLRAGCAVAYGTVVVGIVGEEHRLEHTVIGRPVNRAAKLEDYNKTARSRALTDVATLDAARAQGFQPEIAPEPLPGVAVPGLEGMQKLVVLAK
ncbi:MAG: adenylate/guanylate cyclase domain-containing protein [Rhodobiaceae bacterium]|nr:adenylate/guanylate cyclase domain-containing protein [Rhodobiaceae bacterium]